MDGRRRKLAPGTPIWALGPPRKGGNEGLQFDGVDDSVNAGAGVSLKASSQMTVEAWVFPTSAGEGGYGRIVDKSQGYNLRVGAQHAAPLPAVKVEAFVKQETAGSNAITSGRISLNNWHHVVMVYNEGGDSRTKVYVDGALATLSTDVAGSGALSDPGTTSLIIGNNGDAGSRTFDGKIDEVRIYNRALTATEVAARYSAQPEDTETIHYYLGGKQIAYKKGGTLLYLHQDSLGSSSVVTDSAGALVESTAYYLLRQALRLLREERTCRSPQSGPDRLYSATRAGSIARKPYEDPHVFRPPRGPQAF